MVTVKNEPTTPSPSATFFGLNFGGGGGVRLISAPKYNQIIRLGMNFCPDTVIIKAKGRRSHTDLKITVLAPLNKQ